jgi:hypothetical protein
MKTFKDSEEREWTIEIDSAAIKRVRTLANINLLNIIDGSLHRQFEVDPTLLVDAVYCVCKPQADARGVTDEQFGRAMRGDAIERAATALMEDLADFFPSGKRQMLKKVLSKVTALTDKAIQQANEKLDSPEFDRLVEETLNASSGGLPGSSGSTPDPSHSAS